MILLIPQWQEIANIPACRITTTGGFTYASATPVTPVLSATSYIAAFGAASSRNAWISNCYPTAITAVKYDNNMSVATVEYVRLFTISKA